MRICVPRDYLPPADTGGATLHSVMFELHEDGLLPETRWHNVRKDILTIVRSDGGKRIWEEFGKGGLDPKFVAYVERACASAEASYDMTKI